MSFSPIGLLPLFGRATSFSFILSIALLQEKKWLDLPKLMDICAVYGHDNALLTKTLVNIR